MQMGESWCRREATRALKSAVEAVYEEGSATGILSGAHRTGSGRSLRGGVSHDRGAKRIGGRKRERGTLDVWTRGPTPWFVVRGAPGGLEWRGVFVLLPMGEAYRTFPCLAV